MIDYEELYRKETGLDAKIYVGDPYRYVFTAIFIDWLKQKLTHKDTLLALSEARWRAAEEMADVCFNCAERRGGCGLSCQYYQKYQQSIKDYEAEVAKQSAVK